MTLALLLLMMWQQPQANKTLEPYRIILPADGSDILEAQCSLSKHECWFPKREPIDVPAVQLKPDEIATSHWCGDGFVAESGKLMSACDWERQQPHWTCTDKRRVLLTSEDGEKHCILFK